MKDRQGTTVKKGDTVNSILERKAPLPEKTLCISNPGNESLLFGPDAASNENTWEEPLKISDFIKAVESIPPKPVMPYAFVMSVYHGTKLKEQLPPQEITFPQFPHFMGNLTGGVRTFFLSNKKFKEICEKEPEVNDVNKVFIFDNKNSFEWFMLKHNITEWAEIEET